jgi:TrmH family RNA methyltransferase
MFYPIQLSSNKLKQIRKLKQKKYRNQTDCYLSEGFRLYDAACGTEGLVIRDLILSENFQMTNQGTKILESAQKRGIGVYVADDTQMKAISEDVTPPGILCIIEKQPVTQLSLFDREDKIILYLDRISEPGNLGTILRSASWFGLKTIVLSPECVDPWNSKSVRASAGSIFEANIYTDVKFNVLQENFKRKKYQFIASVVANGIPLSSWDIGSKNIIFLGQEASGLSKEILKHADVHINIPGQGNIESLNLSVATGIILYEATRFKDDV